MFYSLRYSNKYRDEASEIKIDFNQLGTVFDYMKEHPNKRYNIRLTGDVVPENLEQQMEFVRGVVGKNYTIGCYKFGLLVKLLQDGYNAFLDLPITDWETFTNLEVWGVSDIWVDGPIAFCHNALVDTNSFIRISPTVSSGRDFFSAGLADNENTFFIRPEDLHLYEGFIIDFRYGDKTEKEQAAYEIYRTEAYLFDLQLLIDNLSISSQNLFIPKEFGSTRLNCRQICRIPNRACHYCSTALRFPQVFSKDTEEQITE